VREPAFWYRPPSLTSRLLTPLGAVYGLIAALRMQGRGFDAGIPVLCVGNYHTGGAGKTPMVLALTKLLRELGETPVVLSRGYGGKWKGPVKVDPSKHIAANVGDEPLMLALTVPVVIARDRVDGVALARSQGASVILMDDGFQNPAIAKDASLIVIDGDRGLGNAAVFPAGPLRAPLKPQLARTDALVVIGDGDFLSNTFLGNGGNRALGERVFDLHALAQTFAPLGGGDQLAESMLQLLVVGDGDGATVARGCRRAFRAERTSRAGRGIEFDDLARHEGFGLPGRACDGPRAHVDREIALAESRSVA